jgi:iron complex outermembrane receptor protein
MMKDVTSLSKYCGTIVASAIFATILVPPVSASAQQAGANSPEQLQEVIVTAQKRSENIQDVPIAVTAFSAQDLQDKQIQDISGLARLTPNVNLDTASPFGGSNQVLSASIRGIGQDDFALNLDPGVGVYVDGVYYARTTGANANLLDVSQVEILKGPQGTLFGRNTIGGAINVVTRDPGSQYKLETEATTGSYNRRDFRGTADIPIDDKLLTTFTFSSLDRDGYQKRIPYQSSQPYVSDPVDAFHNAGTDTFSTEGGQGETVMRAKVLWKATDDIKVTATLDWTHVDESSVPETLLATATSFATPGAVFGPIYNLCLAGQFNPTVCGPRGPGLSNTVGTPTGLFAPGNAGTSTGNPGLLGANLSPASYRLPYGNQFLTGNIDTTYATGHDFDKMDTFGGAITAEWALNADTELKSISSYRRLQWAVGLDSDGSPLDINNASFEEGQHQFSQEVQLNGKLLDDKIKYSAGLYYFNEGGFEHDYVDLAAGLLQIEGGPAIGTTSYAGYMHVDYTVIDKLTLNLGARYSVDHKTFQEFQDDLNAFNYKISGCYPVSAACALKIGFPDPDNPLQYVPSGTVTQNFYTMTPTIGVQYQFTPDLMSYANYSKGYKDGGWTARVTQPVPAIPSFGPEKAQTVEVGTKSEWLDRRLLLDVAGFYTKYDGIQLNFQEGESPTIKNAGDANIFGAEVEGRWLIGGGLSLAATAGYLDAYYTSLTPGLNFGQACVQPYQPCITLGSKLPKTPKWKSSLSPTYTTHLSNGAALTFGLDYTYTASMFNDSLNTSLLKRSDVNIVNSSVTYLSPDDHYEIAVGGTNITNDRYLTTGNEDTTAGAIWGTYNAPSEWYLTLRLKL